MAVNFLVGLLLFMVISKIVMCITAMKPYSGPECLIGKVALVIGGSTGIGLEVSKCLASRGCRVIVACRTSSNKLSKYLLQETSNSNIVVKHLDLKSFPSVRKFANDILKTENKIDILVNNAEVLFDLSPLIEDDEVDSLLQTNIVSSFLLTHLLIDLLKKSDDPRIIFTTSILAFCHNLSEETLTKRTKIKECTVVEHISRNGDTKMLQVLVSNILAEKLWKFGIKCNSIHPGLVKTYTITRNELLNTYGKAFQAFFVLLTFLYGREIDEGAAGIVELAVSAKHRNTTGQFFWGVGMSNIYPSIRVLKDRELCRNIWEQLEMIVQLKPEEKL